MNKKREALERLTSWPKSLDISMIKNVTTQLQESTQSDIVFYRLNGAKGPLLLEERLKGQRPGILVTYGTSPDKKLDVPHLHLPDEQARKLLIQVCDVLYPLNEKEHRLIGVTGTNGKTSCVGLCAQMMAHFRKSVYSLGTLGLRDGMGEVILPGKLTTPGYPELRRILYDLPNDSCVFLEVSSHALDQDRTAGIHFFAGGWTNFGHDHLDYHQNLEQYFKAKTKIFDFCEKGVFIPESQGELKAKLLQQGYRALIAPSIKTEEVQHLSPIFQVHYNLENLSLSKAIVEKLLEKNLDLSQFDKLDLPLGRMTTIEAGKKLVVIDYAHTPDALDNVCRALKEGFPNKELWVVFGCGGDRDKTKRPLMRKIVEKFTKHIIITSDNPRSEDPLEIIQDILAGCEKEVVYEVDRAAAIKLGLISSPDNALILIAGKGHEEFQEVEGQRLAFSDVDTVKDVLKGF